MLKYVWSIFNVVESRNTEEPNSIFYKRWNFWSFYDDCETQNVNEGMNCRPHMCDMLSCETAWNCMARYGTKTWGGVRYCIGLCRVLYGVVSGIVWGGVRYCMGWCPVLYGPASGVVWGGVQYFMRRCPVLYREVSGIVWDCVRYCMRWCPVLYGALPGVL
jgi:hypothetical protein